MKFLSPTHLLLFIPLAAMIVALYLLKLKRREQVVSSVFLWRDAAADIQANTPFQKLKKSLLLLLQLLAVLGLVLAVARPYTRARGTAENRIIVILDASASMQSTDVAPSRFEQAKSRAIDIVDRMGPGDTMLVATAAARSRVVAGFSSDKRALAAAIRRQRAVDTGCNLREALVVALSLVAGRSKSPPRVVVLSDGGFEPLADLAIGSAQLDFIRVGRRCDNVAITGLDSRKTLSGDQQIFIGMRNFSTRERRFNLEIYLQDKLLDIRDQRLQPGQARQEILSNVSSLGGRVTAKLDISDDLAADNSGSVYLSKPRKVRVVLVTKGNIFLQNALNLDPRTSLTRAESAPTDLDKGAYDIAVFDGIAPPASLPPGGYLLVGASADQGPASQGAVISRPSVIDFSRTHPAAAHVDFAGIRIAEAKRLALKPWAAPLVESQSGPIAAAGTDGGRRFVQLAFDLLETDFPLRVGFPIFVANCLDWLAPATQLGAGETLRTGQPLFIDVPPGTESLRVTAPDGARTLKVTQNPMVYDNTDRAGVYRVEAKGLRREYACNLASPVESGTPPRDAVAVGGKRFASSARAVRTNQEYYWAALLAVLGVLALEWYAYHRRI